MKHMINHEALVSLETAKLLKEVGFDWEGHLSHGGVVYPASDIGKFNDDSYVDKSMCTVPTQAVAEKYMRDVKKYHIMMDCKARKNWLPTVQHTVGAEDYTVEASTSKFGGNGFDSYEEAVDAALQFCAKLIIERIEADRLKEITEEK